MNAEFREVAPGFAEWGIDAFTTTRQFGSLSVATQEPVADVMARWTALQDALRKSGPRFATARQVHATDIVEHQGSWTGWLRTGPADGHLSFQRGTAMGVSVADCVPIFVAHPSGAAAMLHSGWRGTAGRIVESALALFVGRGLAPPELRIHLGPAICGDCYEVSPDVYAQLTGRIADRATTVDLRALIAGQAAGRGVRDVTISPWCTRCHNARFYSHRGGDAGRQLGVLIAST